MEIYDFFEKSMTFLRNLSLALIWRNTLREYDVMSSVRSVGQGKVEMLVKKIDRSLQNWKKKCKYFSMVGDDVFVKWISCMQSVTPSMIGHLSLALLWEIYE